MFFTEKKYIAGLATVAVTGSFTAAYLYRKHHAAKKQNTSEGIESPQPTEAQKQEFITALQKGYFELKHQPGTYGIFGFETISGYPKAFQADYFPVLAGPGGQASIMGPNMAHYFTRTERDVDGSVVAVKQDVSHLETLITNVYEQSRLTEEYPDTKTRFTLIIDSDVLGENKKEAFSKKYLNLRADKGAEFGQPAENAIIRNFLNGGGVRDVVEKVICAKNPGIADYKIRPMVENFLKNNFYVKAIITKDPMTHSVWQIGAPEGELLAAQILSPSTSNINRKWTMGTKPEINALSQHPELGESVRHLEAVVQQMHLFSASAERVSDTNQQMHFSSQHRAETMGR